MAENTERYEKNMQAFSQRELDIIRRKKVCVVGCGGLGGYLCNALVRFGIGELVIVDGDVFAVSNLNRQLFATELTLGQSKAEVAKQKLREINSETQITAYAQMLNKENAAEIIAESDLVVDCLDNVKTRLLLAELCGELDIVIVHGAIAGFYGQVANLFPKDGIIKMIYPSEENHGVEQILGNPSFIPQLVAAIQCSEALKLLAGRDKVLKNQLLHIDLLNNDLEIIDFKN